jgi:hypothetical protein
LTPGIEKKKAKSRLVWDDVVKNWVPRFGYKKVKAEEEKNWMMHYKVTQKILRAIVSRVTRCAFLKKSRKM